MRLRTRPPSPQGDHLPTLESLQPLAQGYGWTVEFRRDEKGDRRARFRPP